MFPSGLIALDDEIAELKIRKEHKELGDDPDSLRWRAWWDKTYDGKVIGVKLECYPVVRLTPCGAWINPHAYRELAKWDEEGATHRWSEPYDNLIRWVGNDSGMAWAKPTQEIAIASLLYRFNRWGQRAARDLGYFLSVANAVKELFPDKVGDADRAVNALKGEMAFHAP